MARERRYNSGGGRDEDIEGQTYQEGKKRCRVMEERRMIIERNKEMWADCIK